MINKKTIDAKLENFEPTIVSLEKTKVPILKTTQEPLMKFSSMTANITQTQKKLLTLTPSQLNLYKNTTANKKRIGKVEETYMRYISGALDKGTLMLDSQTLNKVLKKEYIVEKPVLIKDESGAESFLTIIPKRKPTNKVELFADRQKAVTVLNLKWKNLEEMRIRILIEMKSLKGYHDFLAGLKKENEKLKLLRDRKIGEKNQKCGLILNSIQTMETTLESWKKEYKQKMVQPLEELWNIKRTCKKQLKLSIQRTNRLKQDLQQFDIELEDLKPFQDASYESSYQKKLIELEHLRTANQTKINDLKKEFMNENQELDILGATVTERISERTKSMITNDDIKKLAYIKSIGELLERDFKGHATLNMEMDEEIAIIKQDIAEIKMNNDLASRLPKI